MVFFDQGRISLVELPTLSFMSVYLGLDCGGSSSRVLFIDDSGLVLFQGQSGAANLVSTPESRLRRNLNHASYNCPAPEFVCGCFAGMINEETRIFGLTLLKGLFPAAKIRVEPDYTAAFYACPQGTDLCVIAGTGSLVCSRQGKSMVKSGGRGYLLGDYGSGYQYGRDALVHYLDHRKDASPRLLKSIEEVYGTVDEGLLVTSVYRAPTPATQLAKLAKAISLDAAEGHPYAVASVKKNVGQLMEIVAHHIDTYVRDQKQVKVCLAGGLWKGCASLRDSFAKAISARMPDREIEVVRIGRPPIYGAIELAKELKNGN